VFLHAILISLLLQPAFWLLRAARSGPLTELQTEVTAAPTLDETATWLSSNLITLHYSYSRTTVKIDPKKKQPDEKTKKTYNLSGAILQASMNKCALTLVERETTDAGDWSSAETTTYQVPIDKLDAAKLEVLRRKDAATQGNRINTFEPEYYMALTLQSARENIIWISHTVDSSAYAQPKASDDRGTSEVMVLLSDDSIFSQRILNAFNHSIKLCREQSKPEPF
jgi:hypothetical protein